MIHQVALLLMAPAPQHPLREADWEAIGPAKYSIEKGEIVGISVVSSENSFLVSRRTYTDFQLEFEVRVDQGLNSGVQIRSMSVPGYREGRFHGYQVEIDPASGESGGIYDEERRGWLKKPATNAFKAGAWNHYRIRAVGSSLQTWVNGKPAANLEDRMTRWGRIGFQVHSTDKAGMQVRWRKVRLTELGPTGGPYASDVLPQIGPPIGGKWLLKEAKDLANWVSEGDPTKPAPWKWVGGAVQTGGGDIVTREAIGSCRLHVEFKTDENGLHGQANGNSGVYPMRSYEVQVLNSAPRGPLIDECGAIYGIKVPDFAMAFRAGQWQSYDIDFIAPRWEGDKKISSARMTVYHNGTLIHNDVEVPRATTAGVPESPGLRGIRLQDHGNKVQYRNIWVAPL